MVQLLRAGHQENTDQWLQGDFSVSWRFAANPGKKTIKMSEHAVNALPRNAASLFIDHELYELAKRQSSR
jgi:hypothetical protein